MLVTFQMVFYSNTKDENQDPISYSFKVKDGKVVFYEDENLVIEDEILPFHEPLKS